MDQWRILFPLIVLVWVCFLHNRAFDQIWFSCGTVHLLQVQHASKNPPGLEEQYPAAFMSLATHSLERHHNDAKNSGCRVGNLAWFCSTSLTQDLGSNPVITEILSAERAQTRSKLAKKVTQQNCSWCLVRSGQCFSSSRSPAWQNEVQQLWLKAVISPFLIQKCCFSK